MHVTRTAGSKRLYICNIKSFVCTRIIESQQDQWKRHRWQKMDTEFLRAECDKQLMIVRSLPDDVFAWDVYMGLTESITTVQVHRAADKLDCLLYKAKGKKRT